MWNLRAVRLVRTYFGDVVFRQSGGLAVRIGEGEEGKIRRLKKAKEGRREMQRRRREQREDVGDLLARWRG